jgi:hypothetical protein
LVQDRGGVEFQTGGILLYVEDLKRGTNKDIEPKDIFEMASSYVRWLQLPGIPGLPLP